MTRVLADIFKEPAQLSASLDHTLSSGALDLECAAAVLRDARCVVITGIGASWHAGMAMETILREHGMAVSLVDASELLYFAEIPQGAAVVLLSRSGRSLEIVRLVEKVKSEGAAVIAITNTPDSPLAQAADIALYTSTDFDHGVSISTYSTLAMTSALLACRAVETPLAPLVAALAGALALVEPLMEEWQRRIIGSGWLDANATTYFLARGSSLASAHEARLLWEEAAKAPATALTTGGFRHGPQEIVKDGFRVALWLDAERLRPQDLALAADLRRLGAKVLLIGQKVDSSKFQTVIDLPAVPRLLQSVVDIIPIQIAAEALATLRDEDCDVFRLCSYIVEDEGGLGEPRCAPAIGDGRHS